MLRRPIETTALIVQVPRLFASITSSNAVSGTVGKRCRTCPPAALIKHCVNWLMGGRGVSQIAQLYEMS